MTDGNEVAEATMSELYPLRGTDKVSLMPEAIERASRWLCHELGRPDSFFGYSPRKGFARGIEFYSGYDLLHIMARSIAVYASEVGCWPDLITPLKQTEKLIWMKFFGYLPIPTPANKLTVGNFIPPAFRDRVRTARKLWRSTSPKLPPAGAVPKGKHFLKVNNGSGYNLLLDFPLNAITAPKVQQRIHQMFEPPRLARGGEWWYAMMQPEIFVEQLMDAPGNITEWKFHICNGVCHHVLGYECDHRDVYAITVYDRNFNHIPVQVTHLAIGRVCHNLPQFELMRDAAEAIARDMLFARVEFCLTGKGQVYLGEITLCPNNAINYYTDPTFDNRIGDRWDHLAQYRDQ